MSTLNFPLNPTVDQLYSFGGKTWIWTGQAWRLNSDGAINNIPIGNTTPSTGAFTTVSAAGNITGNYFLGNGSQLTGLAPGNTIFSGNSNVLVYPNSAVTVSSNGVSNVMVVTSQDVTITGNLTVTGNATLSGNIIGDRIQNGNTSIDIQTINGNANISVSGVSNVAVFTPSGLDVTGNITVSGNVLGDLDVSGNVTANTYYGSGTALIGVLADRGNDTNNYNLLTQMGLYTVNRSSWSGVTGAPLDSQVFVGMLEVKNTGNTAIEQIFYPGTVTTDVKIQWNRANWNGVWTSWVRIINDEQIVSGGVF